MTLLALKKQKYMLYLEHMTLENRNWGARDVFCEEQVLENSKVCDPMKDVKLVYSGACFNLQVLLDIAKLTVDTSVAGVFGYVHPHHECGARR